MQVSETVQRLLEELGDAERTIQQYNSYCDGVEAERDLYKEKYDIASREREMLQRYALKLKTRLHVLQEIIGKIMLEAEEHAVKKTNEEPNTEDALTLPETPSASSEPPIVSIARDVERDAQTVSDLLRRVAPAQAHIPSEPPRSAPHLRTPLALNRFVTPLETAAERIAPRAPVAARR